MSLLKKTSAHSFLYMFFQGVGLTISLISFPIITRIFSVEDYGNLVLVNTTLSLMIAFAKCGITNSFIRHYPEFTTDGEKRHLYSSALGGSVLISAGIVVIYSTALFFLRDLIDAKLLVVLLVVGVIILFRNVEYIFTGFFRAEERILTLNIVSLLYKVGSLGLGLLVCLLLSRALYGYFLGVVLFEGLMISVLAFMFYGRKVLGPRAVSRDIFRKLYRYGIPLTFFEIAALVNDYSDRFLIKFFLGSTQVGIYSAGYNLSLYVKGFLTAPIWMTIFPIYTKLWEETDGREKTEVFLSQLLKYYFCIGVLIVFTLSLLSGELITILATEKYIEASRVVPFIVSSVIVYGSASIVNAGFYLTKQTKKVAYYTIICASCNILLNLYFIPHYGIMGAAYSSVISYLLLTVMLAVNSRKLLKITWPFRDILFYILFAIIMTTVLVSVDFGSNLLNLILKSILGFFVYSTCVFIYDGEIRKIVFSFLRPATGRN